MKNRFKNIDLIKIIPEEYKESTYLGLCSSLFFVFLAALLIFNQLTIFLSDEIYSEIEVDHFKDDKDLTVHLAMKLHAYPCSLLSLDKLDKVRTHTMDVAENLVKRRMSRSGEYLDVHVNDPNKPFPEKIEVVRQHISDGEGCYLSGNFTIKLVPGNFHVSFHNYFPEFQNAISQMGYRPDFSYTIEHLYFGESDEETMDALLREFDLEPLHTLKNVEELGLKDRIGFPHGVTHRINIVPSKFIRSDEVVFELFQFTSNTQLNKQTNNMAMTFEFDLENLRMVYHKRHGTFSHFCIQSVAILGGMYMFIFLLKSFVEDGVLDMIYKRKIGKFD